jgi:hypothetical protein
MPDLFQEKLKLFSLIFLTGFFSFCFFTEADAFLLPGVFVSELRINEIKGQEIQGEFTVWNSETYYLADLNYEIKLFQGTDFNELELIDVDVIEETFFLAPNQKITKSFAYRYPKNIVSGSYTLRAQIITERGGELGWEDQTASLQGENKFLEIDYSSAKVLIKGEEFLPLTGPAVAPEDNVTAVFDIKNPGEKITAVPEIKIFKRKFNMPMVKEYRESPITFDKGETKEIKLEMPKFEEPESYLAEVKFYEDNEQVSGIVYFRWVVEGEGGKILYIKTDKDSYRAGENMEITIDSVGPADLSTIGEGQLEVIVYDKDKNIVGQSFKNVALGPGIVSSVISIPIKKDLISPVIEAKLTKSGNILDERKIEFPVSPEKAKQIEKEINKKEQIKKLLIYLGSAAIILLLIGFLAYRLKKKIKK